jgi:hypothetical protein
MTSDYKLQQQQPNTTTTTANNKQQTTNSNNNNNNNSSSRRAHLIHTRGKMAKAPKGGREPTCVPLATKKYGPR